ncbi:cell division protein ZapA [Erythrobacter crassostreae]|uniref:Cell division protein ZapA n=1 Tax=Erythrobacter crassostreae TaxID=2828328 RepID=A0A9X1F3W8_9SPHN|nr:cell division protein ZapA [Erythrobacter crassostrea]MBV7259816.1 cell division protein ZapA [Erythrobacter crassostrea]
MSQVKLTIGSRTYPVNCADGEEDHIAKLGAMINEKYEQLGGARAPQETQNMLFAALFLADELAEARKVAKKSSETVEHEKAKSGGKKAELKTEIDTLTKAEARAREEIAELKEQLSEMREAASHQHDMFGAPAMGDDIIEKLEALALRAEETATALEGTAQSS